MSNESIVTIVSGILQTGAVSFVVFMIIKGLRQQVTGLKQTIEVQSKTIDAMDKRVNETEKISELYRKFIEDYPKALDSYKATIVQTKDDVILDLTKRVESQKDEIKELNDKIEKLNPKERMYFEKITGLLLTEGYKPFQEFIQKIDESKDKIVYNLIKSNNFDEFMNLNGYTISIDTNLTKKLFSLEEIPEKRIRTASFSITGTSYAFSFGKEFLVNDIGKEILNKYYLTLKI